MKLTVMTTTCRFSHCCKNTIVKISYCSLANETHDFVVPSEQAQVRWNLFVYFKKDPKHHATCSLKDKRVKRRLRWIKSSIRVVDTKCRKTVRSATSGMSTTCSNSTITRIRSMKDSPCTSYYDVFVFTQRKKVYYEWIPVERNGVNVVQNDS